MAGRLVCAFDQGAQHTLVVPAGVETLVGPNRPNHFGASRVSRRVEDFDMASQEPNPIIFHSTAMPASHGRRRRL